MPADVREPCQGSGEETAVGSVFFSDRRESEHPDGHRSDVCTLCDQRIAASRRGRQLTDDEARRLIETGWPAMIGFVPGGH